MLPGVRTSDARIYEIAPDVMQAEPAASLFVDDREENVAGARAVGLRARHAPDPDRLVEYLRDAGIKTWTERDGETGDANDHEDTA